MAVSEDCTRVFVTLPRWFVEAMDREIENYNRLAPRYGWRLKSRSSLVAELVRRGARGDDELADAANQIGCAEEWDEYIGR